MEFKIDTKTNYSILTPVSNRLDENMTAAISQKWKELMQSGSKNIIVDLHNCISLDEHVLSKLILLHEEFYSQDCSLVFTNLQDEVVQVLKKEALADMLNITPTFAEAADIINMEILERDLFNEEL